MNGYEIGLTMFVIDYFALRNEREQAEQFIEYAYLKLDIDRGMYRILYSYLETAFKRRIEK